MQKSKSNFELLRSKPILAILDGDHARLFVNSAMTMAEFVLSVCEHKTKR